jgi:hypothetical protein
LTGGIARSANRSALTSLQVVERSTGTFETACGVGMIFGSLSRRRLCCPREAACSSGGSASTFGRPPFRCCGRVVSGLALPVGMT